MSRIRLCIVKMLASFVVTCILTFASMEASAIVISDNGQYPLGSLLQNNSNPFYGVVNVGGGCSGTPISTTLVVSAAHCFDRDDPGGEADSSLTTVYYFSNGSLSSVSGTPYNHPSYAGLINGRGSITSFANDVAVITLNAPLPANVPLFRLAHFSEVPIGAVIEHAGYGLAGYGSSGANTRDGVFQLNATFNVIDTIYNGGLTFGTDFDGAGINRMGGGVLGISTLDGGFSPYEGTTAPGDSGGPAFFNPYLFYRFNPPPRGVSIKLVPDEYFLVGVTSFGSTINNNGYGSTSGYTFLGAYNDWIQNFSTGLSIADLSNFPFPDVSPASFVISNEIVWVDPPPIPEPSTGTLMLVGLIVILTITKRRQYVNYLQQVESKMNSFAYS